MVIGIDLDGLLFDSAKQWIKKGMEYASKYNIRHEFHPEEFTTLNIFKWGVDTDIKFWNQYFREYYQESIPTKEAVETIKKLKEEGHKICIITSRGSLDFEKTVAGVDWLKKVTPMWLDRNGIPYDNLIYTISRVKSKICLEGKVEVLVDDNIKTCKEVSNVIPTIVFNRPYNEKVRKFKSNYEVFRAKNWNDVYNIIECKLK